VVVVDDDDDEGVGDWSRIESLRMPASRFR
jgi:hypothetical protein